jgi:hypothetical protein
VELTKFTNIPYIIAELGDDVNYNNLSTGELGQKGPTILFHASNEKFFQAFENLLNPFRNYCTRAKVSWSIIRTKNHIAFSISCLHRKFAISSPSSKCSFKAVLLMLSQHLIAVNLGI